MNKSDKSKKMKEEFKYTKSSFSNEKKKYPGAQNIPKNNMRINRSGRGN